MARIRTIKPEFWDSPDTARASLRARLFYIAMWNWADDYGKGTASAKQLVGFAFPNDDDITVSDYPSLAKDVADCFGVVFYTVDRRPYYAIPSFPEHQRTEKRAKSRIPDPPEDVSAGQKPWDGMSDDSDGPSDVKRGTSVSGTGEQGNRGTGKKTPSSAAADGPFAQFWDLYPRKVGKGAAVKAFKTALRKASVEAITEGLRVQLPILTKSEVDFIPHASTWLNGERWADVTPTKGPGHFPAGFPANGTQAEKDAWVAAQPLPTDGAYYGGSAR